MKPALLLVDLQYDFLRTPVLYPAAEDITERAGALLDGFRAAALAIFHIWTSVSCERDDRMPHWVRAGKWACVEGTPGHATPDALRPKPGEYVIRKTFFSGFSSGELERLLRTAGCDAVFIAGVHEHGCVRATALDAYGAALSVWIAQDAVASDDPLHAAITRRYLKERAAGYATVAELLRKFGSPKRSRWATPPDIALPALWVGGHQIAAGDLPCVGHTSPLEPERPIWSIPECGAHEAARATSDAKQVQPLWERTTLATRIGVLERFAELLEAQSGVDVRMATEIGKPITQGRGETVRSVALIRAALRRAGEALEIRCSADSVARYRPLGTVAFVAPWNNPVAIPVGKIVPALLYGNTVVMKPAPAGSAVALWLARLLQQAGLPDGALNLVMGSSESSQALIADPYVDAVTITGSCAAGYAAAEVCARRHIPLQAELGGNNAAIVWHDCDLDLAAALVAEGAFGFAGQRCTANRRAIIDDRCYDSFVQKLADRTRALHWGDPRDPSTQIGPLVSAAARARVGAVVDRAAPTARAVIRPHLGGPQAATRGDAWFAPTIVCCDDPSHEIVQHETFGPVLVVQRARDFDEALALCNGVAQGLVAALFSLSETLRQEFLHRAQAGILKLNRSTVDANAEAPFGGWKSSGAGPAEHGPSNREFYTRVQSVYE
jgi:alpha-ketoglutaric semialdehyde dehydrogenase